VVAQTIGTGVGVARAPVGIARHPALRGIKRAIDIVGSSVLIVALLPLALIIALAIAIDSRGPVLFRQRRVGRGGVEFPLIKFRTMVRDGDAVLAAHVEADEELRREWEETRKLRDDPRVTRLGRFLRRSSLDELPQLLNVFIGNMSLVGPRPVPRDELAYFGDRAVQILEMRPGLTGLWAVSGRSEISYEERVELEHRYVVDWNLRMDAAILLRTIPAVVRGHGAY
jgi:exopolysaccharide production protein ExoY